MTNSLRIFDSLKGLFEMVKEKVFSVRLDDLALSEMELIAKSRGVPVAAILREWIDTQLSSVDRKEGATNLIIKLKAARNLIDQAIEVLESKSEE